MFDSLSHSIIGLARHHQDIVTLIVFGLGLGESIPVLSLFIPSTVLFLGIGALYAEIGGSYWHLALAGGGGAFLGDVISFIFGWYFRHRLTTLWPFTRDPDLLPRSQAFFERWGTAGIFASKFLGAVRAFVPLTAGMMDMPWLLFALASLGSSLLWAGVLLAPGFGVSALIN